MAKLVLMLFLFSWSFDCLAAGNITSDLVCRIGFEDSFTNGNRQATDSTGFTNFVQFPTDIPYTLSGNYQVNSRGVGRVGSWAMRQNNFGTNEYAAIVFANFGDPDDFPGYTIMTYGGITNVVQSGISNMPVGTVGFWFYSVQTAAQNPSATIVSMGVPGVSNSIEISAFHNESDSKIAFTILTNTQANPQFVSAKCPDFTLNQWTHCAFVWDGGANSVKIYINGELYATGTMNGATSLNIAYQGDKPWIVLMAYGHDEMLPVNPHGPNNGWCGDGAMLDEFRIYTRALTTEDVLLLYNYNENPTINTSSSLGGKAVIEGKAVLN